MHKTLLLNHTNDILSFITERKALRLLIKEKADIVSVWDGVQYRSTSHVVINLPSILKMRYYVKRNYSPLPFSRRAVLKRDKYTCSYCLKILKPSTGTIDHIVPKSRGGRSSFVNCVTACYLCNSKKGQNSIEDAGMALINKPFIPSKYLYYLTDDDARHEDWFKFIKE